MAQAARGAAAARLLEEDGPEPDDQPMEELDAYIEDMQTAKLAPSTRLGYERGFRRAARILISLGLADLVGDDGLPKVPMGTQTILRVLGEVGKKKADGSTVTSSTVCGYFAAIRYAHIRRQSELEANTSTAVTDFVKGFQRTQARARESGIGPQTEGKMELPVLLYRALCRYALDTLVDPALHAFGHAFMVISWNMLNRSASTGGISIANVTWDEDALVIDMPRSKGDQTGENAMPRRLYANPTDPTVCPVLALSLFAFSSASFGVVPDTATGGPLLFGRSNSEQKFSEFNTKLLERIDSEVVALSGHSARAVGTHSYRKGAATFLTNILDGPNGMAIFLRAGWDLGVQKRYLFVAGQDAFVGRCSALLNLIGPNFADLPPHFASPAVPGEFGVSWPALVKHYANLPATFTPVLERLLASLVHHQAWLRQTYPRHPVLRAPVFTSGLVERLAAARVVHTGAFENAVTGLKATGVPSTVLLRREIQCLNAKFTALEQRQAQFEDRLTAVLLDELKLVPERVAENIMRRFVVEGTTPLTLENMREVARQMVGDVLRSDEFRDVLRGSLAPQGAADATAAIAAQAAAAAAAAHDSPSWYGTWNYGGRFQLPVPEGFRLGTSLNAFAGWSLWHFGDRPARIRPYRLLSAEHHLDARDRPNLTKLKKVVQKMPEPVAPQGGLRPEDTTAFNTAFAAICARVYAQGVPARADDLTYSTLYEKMRKAGLFNTAAPAPGLLALAQAGEVAA